MSERFDGRAAWAQLTGKEQADIGRLAVETIVCADAHDAARVHAVLHAAFFDLNWPDPQSLGKKRANALNVAVILALRRAGLFPPAGQVFPPPAALGEPFEP